MFTCGKAQLIQWLGVADTHRHWYWYTRVARHYTSCKEVLFWQLSWLGWRRRWRGGQSFTTTKFGIQPVNSIYEFIFGFWSSSTLALLAIAANASSISSSSLSLSSDRRANIFCSMFSFCFAF